MFQRGGTDSTSDVMLQQPTLSLLFQRGGKDVALQQLSLLLLFERGGTVRMRRRQPE